MIFVAVSPSERLHAAPLHEGKRGSANGCSFVFSSEIRGGEILLPFLILASTSKNEIIRAGEEGRLFDPEKGLIVVKLAAEYKDRPLTFIFPTCQGIYYEALAE